MKLCPLMIVVWGIYRYSVLLQYKKHIIVVSTEIHEVEVYISISPGPIRV